MVSIYLHECRYYVNATKFLEFRNSSIKSKNSEPVPSPGKYLTHSTSNGYLTKSYSITGLEYNGRVNTLPRSHQKHDLNKHLLEGTSEMSMSISTIPHDPNGDKITVEHKVKSSSVSQVRIRPCNALITIINCRRLIGILCPKPENEHFETPNST